MTEVETLWACCPPREMFVTSTRPVCTSHQLVWRDFAYQCHMCGLQTKVWLKLVNWMRLLQNWRRDAQKAEHILLCRLQRGHFLCEGLIMSMGTHIKSSEGRCGATYTLNVSSMQGHNSTREVAIVPNRDNVKMGCLLNTHSKSQALHQSGSFPLFQFTFTSAILQANLLKLCFFRSS